MLNSLEIKAGCSQSVSLTDLYSTSTFLPEVLIRLFALLQLQLQKLYAVLLAGISKQQVLQAWAFQRVVTSATLVLG